MTQGRRFNPILFKNQFTVIYNVFSYGDFEQTFMVSVWHKAKKLPLKVAKEEALKAHLEYIKSASGLPSGDKIKVTMILSGHLVLQWKSD